MNDLLSKDEMIELTGASQASVQRRVLNDHGIFVLTRNDNTVTTTWHHVHNPTSIKSHNDEAPDFSQVK